MELSKRVQSVAPSVTLAIAAKAQEMRAQGIDVVSLSAGEPDFDTPDYIKQAAIDALKKGATKYTQVAGTPELRKAIAEKLERDQGLKFPTDQIIVSVGAKHAIFNVMFALLNEGETVAIPAPYWLSYPEMVTVLGGKSRIIPTTEETEFKVTPEILKKYLDQNTRLFILNSPSNPTGAVYSQKELAAVAEVLKSFPKLIILRSEEHTSELQSQR